MRPFRIDRLCGPAAPLVAGDGTVLAARCYRASSAAARLVGLLGTPDLAEDEALWLEPCGSVHTVLLRAPIGCAFLDGEGRVIRVVDPLPRSRAASARGARAVVECRPGVLAGIAPGTRLERGSSITRDARPPGPRRGSPGPAPGRGSRPARRSS
jgi:uncharacterized membrane protein (UPF0127 family)